MKTLAIATCALTFGLTLFGGLTDGLIAHYKFDGDAKDSSTNNNNGVAQGATLTPDRFGNAKRAYAFGDDKWIEVANSISLQSVTNALTFSAWIKQDPNRGVWFPVLCKGYSKRQFGFELYSRDCIWLNDYCGTVHGKHMCVGGLPAGTCDMDIWFHLSASYDGKVVKAYVNGRNVGSNAVSDNSTHNTAKLYIGMDPPGGTDFLHGAIDEIRIYNRTLSDKEIADIWALESRNR